MFLQTLDPSLKKTAIEYSHKENGQFYTWNSYFRYGAKLSKTDLLKIERLTAFLEAAPKYEGVSYRSMDLKNAEVVERFIQEHKVGDVYSTMGFTSTAATKEGADTYKGKFYSLTIKFKSKKGVYLSTLSLHPEDREVLFGHDISFIITKLRREGYHISMDLVDHEKETSTKRKNKS